MSLINRCFGNIEKRYATVTVAYLFFLIKKIL